MISIIITAYKEPNTVGRCIESIINQQIKDKFEIIVVCPDEETKKEALKFKNIKHIQDPGLGKPTALNLAFKEAMGDILILTDGDVFLEKESINKILIQFNNKNVGAVSGHPIPLNERNRMIDFWAHLLTEVGAHRTRLEKDR